MGQLFRKFHVILILEMFSRPIKQFHLRLYLNFLNEGIFSVKYF